MTTVIRAIAEFVRLQTDESFTEARREALMPVFMAAKDEHDKMRTELATMTTEARNAHANANKLRTELAALQRQHERLREAAERCERWFEGATGSAREARDDLRAAIEASK